MKASGASAGGFTLIEVLVALALMSLIAIILLASLQVGGETFRRVTFAAARSEEMADSHFFLRSRLERMHPDPLPTLAPDVLQSDGSELQFFAPGPIADGGQLTLYRLRVNPDLHTLEIAQLESQSEMRNEAAVETLLTHVARAQMSFWKVSDESSGRWVHSWSGSSLPRLVRIEVEFLPGSKAHWPVLVAQPRIDASVDCQFDSVSRRCRQVSL